jgi:hypothetical protein
MAETLVERRSAGIFAADVAGHRRRSRFCAIVTFDLHQKCAVKAFLF